VYSPCQRTVEPVVDLIESSKAFHFPFAFQLFQAKKRLQQIELVEKHGTDKQAFLFAYEFRKILPETEKSISELSMANKTIQLHLKGNKGIKPSILVVLLNGYKVTACHHL
jgi:hypothetical protein